MTDTYDWKVATLDRNISKGSVFVVHYTVSASRTNTTEDEGNYTAGSYGSVGVSADPSSSSFIPYENLTEENCIDWVKESLGSESVDSIETAITSDLNNQINPTDAAGVPWATETTTAE